MALHRAAELIATGRYTYSCRAVKDSGCLDLVIDYADFYNKLHNSVWQLAWSPHKPFEARVFHRIMLILWFAEVGPEGIGKTNAPQLEGKRDTETTRANQG